MGEYWDGTALKPLGSLQKHRSMSRCWVGTMNVDGKERAIVIHEGTRRPVDWEPGMPDEPSLILFENPAATLLMKDAKED